MPAIINNPLRSSLKTASMEKRKEFRGQYRHVYPGGKDVSPGSELSDKIVDEILLRARESERFLSQRHTTWRQMDRSLTCFIPIDEYEAREKAKDSRTPVSIVVPEIYANRETIMTYLMAVYGQSPMFSISGTGPEDTLGGILFEHIIQNQIKRAKSILPIYTHCSDSLTYGIGILAASWSTKYRTRSVNRDILSYDTSGPFVTGRERVREPVVAFEGVHLDCIDPYLYLPDPTVDLYTPEKGNWVGWKTELSYLKLKRMELDSPESFFNIDALKDAGKAQSSIYLNTEDVRNPDITSDETYYSDTLVDVIFMYVDIIPKEWDLSDSEEPEIWLFGIAGDAIVICAHPLDLDYGEFPVAVAAPDFGGHEQAPIARMELMNGLQEVINFYFNSHVANVRRALNMVLVADPKSVNMRRLMAHDSIITTRKQVWGQGVKNAIEQLRVDDVTSNHIPDMMMARDIGRNILGSVDAVQGIQRTRGERVTAEEFRSTKLSALSRLQLIAQKISIQSMYSVGLMHAFMTQQFMKEESYIKVVGEMEMRLRSEYGITDSSLRVSPFDINIDFDLEVSDGTSLVGADPAIWMDLLKTLPAYPELIQTMDVSRIILHAMRVMGEKNVQDFIRKVPVKTVSDESAQAEAGKGNLVPMGVGRASSN